MKPAQLLDQFDRISDAPDAIPRLRRFILDLAVRGKLVEQNPNDEPASELVKRIRAGRDRSSQQHYEKKHDPPSPVGLVLAGFQVARNWQWVRLGDVADVVMGQSPPGETYNATGDGIPLINGPVEFTDGPFGKTIINQYTTAPTNLCEAGDLLLCVRGSTTGRTNVAACRACIGRGVAAIHSLLDDSYIRLCVWRLRESILAVGRGVAFPSVSRRQIEDLPIPLPPLAEQHRIVAKVDELMALCDRLDAAQTDRERRRDRLAAASLQRLNQPVDTPAFPEHADFQLRHLPRMTTRPDQIPALRQSVLNLAVRGRLVPQDPNDDPASRMLQSIQDERRNGTCNATRRVHPGQEDNETPFRIPSSWLWLRIGNVFDVAGGIQKTPHRMPKDNAFPYLGVANVYRGRIDLTTVKQFELQDGELETRRLEAGDLLIIEGNGSLTEVGRCALWNGEIKDCVHQNHVIRCRPFDVRISPFVLRFLNSPAGMAVMQRLAITSSGLYSLSVGKIRQIDIPFPPISEQHRIVAKVEELMAVCDRLEAQLTTVQTESSRLLEAVLHEALAPAVKSIDQVSSLNSQV